MQAIGRQPQWPPNGATAHDKRHRPEPTTLYCLDVSFFVLFVAVWATATFGGLVSKTLLADPLTIVKGGYKLPAATGFGWHTRCREWRVLGRRAGVALGGLMGAPKPVKALFEPSVGFACDLSASAFIPLLMQWVGIGEALKLAVVSIGSFFQLVQMVAVNVGNTRRDLVEAAYTLGVSNGSMICRAPIPGAAPEVAQILPMVLGWAWPYVIVAELTGASGGIGHMLTDSQTLLANDQIICGIIVIGLLSDLIFKFANRRFFLERCSVVDRPVRRHLCGRLAHRGDTTKRGRVPWRIRPHRLRSTTRSCVSA